MKMSIGLHEECLNNFQKFIERERKKLNNMQINVERKSKEFDFYKFQIDEAKRRGKNGFDENSFCKKLSK
jgi:hypothetical protein